MYASFIVPPSQQGTPCPQRMGNKCGVGGGPTQASRSGDSREGVRRVAPALPEEDAARKSDTRICQVVYPRFFLKVNVMGNQSKQRGGDREAEKWKSSNQEKVSFTFGK